MTKKTVQPNPSPLQTSPRGGFLAGHSPSGEKEGGRLLFLSLGSNLGDRAEMLHRAIALIEERVGTVQRVSSFIETEPWGFKSKHPFLNAACLVLTTLSPEQCLDATQHIERELGRKRKSKNGIYHDRPIDIDLLMYDDLTLSAPRLTLPHPRMKERDFVMIPLREILLPDEG